MSYQQTIILSLGGSLIVPKEGIDTQFLTNFNHFIRQQIAEHQRRFFIICGGGAITRNYQKAAREIIGHQMQNEDKDWLGIHSTRLNAHLIRTIFRDVAYPRIIKHFDQEYDVHDEPVIVCSGWKPGHSSDYCAVTIANKYKVKTVINLSNIDKVYDKDPKKYPDALPIDRLTWTDFEKLVGDKWVPGVNVPFDPIATKLAKKLDLNVIILNGKNIINLGYAIAGKKFIGTTISSQV